MIHYHIPVSYTHLRTDLLAEAVQLNGKVWAKDAQVVTGKNAVSDVYKRQEPH